jgi:hypothetical protein
MSVVFYQSSVEFYKGSVEFYGKPVEFYGKPVEFYECSVEFYRKSVEFYLETCSIEKACLQSDGQANTARLSITPDSLTSGKLSDIVKI